MYDKSYVLKKPLLERIFHKYCDRWFIKKLKDANIKTILDVGGGDGRLTSKLYAHGFHVTYNDISDDLCKEMAKFEFFIKKGDFLSIDIKPRQFDCLIFSFGVLNHITLGKAWKKIEELEPKMVLAWISNKYQLEYYLKFNQERLVKFIGNDFDYSLISSNQYTQSITGINIHNYSYDDLKGYGFDEIKPYPTYLWLADWKINDPYTLQFLTSLDKKYPNKKFCSGFLVEKRFRSKKV